MGVQKPTVDDVVGWLNLQSDPSDGALDVYTECILTAIDHIEERVSLPAGTTDDNYPQWARTAELLLASRLAKRSTSPEGVSGMSDLGAVVRIMARDPDIETLIMRHRNLLGFV